MTRKSQRPTNNYTCLLFDLDDTLYPHTNGIWEKIRERINHYLLEEMHFAPEVVPVLRKRLWKQYGTTLRGLQVEYSVNVEDYLAYVHDVPLHGAISPDPELQSLLEILPQRKVIFTNADEAHALRVMEALGVTDQFEMIIDVHKMAPYCKPEPGAFHKALGAIGEPPENCLLLDDSPGNLSTAQGLGMGTVSVGIHNHEGSPHIAAINELGQVLGY